MVGIVVVSHSSALAEGVRELALGMAQESGVAVEAAGGLDEPDRPLGTDAALVTGAIERADDGDGVVVLMDLGSAVMSAEMALEMLDPELSKRVRLCAAPLVEGAVAATATAGTGAPLEDVEREARRGLAGKESHLGEAGGSSDGVASPDDGPDDGDEIELTVGNPLGLHARPAARFVRTAGHFDASVTVKNLSTGKGPADARSLSGLATLGVAEGHKIAVRATGPQAADALGAFEELAANNFGDGDSGSGDSGAPDPGAARPEAGDAAEPVDADRPLPGAVLRGLPVASGLASGPARRLEPAAFDVTEERAEDADSQWAALGGAIAGAAADIEDTRRSVARRAGEGEAAIFDAHLLMLEDSALMEPARAAIFDDGLTAAAAFKAAADRVAGDYLALEDDYLRARADDVKAVARQVIAHLLGAGSTQAEASGIVVARELTPAEVAGLDPTVVRGIATAFGGPTSHSSILARSLGIPTVAGLGPGLLAIDARVTLLLDGDAGTIVVDPGATVAAEHESNRRAKAEAARSARALAREPAVTRDGVRVTVLANASSAEDAEAALASGAEGIGLLRTELFFLGRADMPDEDEQHAAYRDVASALDGKPLTVRTLDVGADKPLPYVDQIHEDNPYLGMRGIRLALAKPEILEVQLRAVLRTAADYPVRVMFPMVATPGELRAAAELVGRAGEALNEQAVAVPETVPIGVMIEVPAAALRADALAPYVDFFSIGTNDLAQYVMAAERGNDRVAPLSDALHPPVLGLINAVAEAGARNDVEVAVCGELAGDPIAVPLLVGLGITELSVSATLIPEVKAAVRASDRSAAKALAGRAASLDSAADVREMLASPSGAKVGAP